MKQCNVSIAQFTALSILYALLESNSKKHFVLVVQLMTALQTDYKVTLSFVL